MDRDLGSRRGPQSPAASAPSAGFTLVELLTAITILALVVVGVAYTLSTSRGFVDRFALQREALARVEQRLEELQYPTYPADTILGVHAPARSTEPLAGRIGTQESIRVDPVDDIADGQGGNDPNPLDYKMITVTLKWTVGSTDSVSLSSYFMAK